MTSEDSHVEKVWAYVHGQMDPDERAAWEQTLKQDSVLQKDVDGARALDRRLRVLLPLPERTEEELEDRILAAWEATAGRASSGEPSAARLVFPDVRARIRTIPFRWFALAAAAAAAVVLVMAPPGYWGGPIRWTRPEIDRLEYRNVAPPFTQQDVLRGLSALRKSVQEGYDRERLATGGEKISSDRRLTLRLRFQETPGGGFDLRVIASTAKEEVAREWSVSCPSLDAFLTQVDTWGNRTGRELREFQAGKRP